MAWEGQFQNSSGQIEPAQKKDHKPGWGWPKNDQKAGKGTRSVCRQRGANPGVGKKDLKATELGGGGGVLKKKQGGGGQKKA